MLGSPFSRRLSVSRDTFIRSANRSVLIPRRRRASRSRWPSAVICFSMAGNGRDDEVFMSDILDKDRKLVNFIGQIFFIDGCPTKMKKYNKLSILSDKYGIILMRPIWTTGW